MLESHKSISFKMDRLDILDGDVAFDLNTYRNWGQFKLMIEPFPNGEGGYFAPDQDNPTVPAFGTKSLFNNVHAVYYSNKLRQRTNMPLIDTQQARQIIHDESDCTVRALVKNSAEGKMGRSIYNYSDFMYCTELGRVPNNYMVTLRRFSAPCGDNILFVDPNDPDETSVGGLQSHAPDIGRMVNWIGVSGNEMSNILKYDYSMPFKEVHAEIYDIEGVGDDSGTKGLGALLNATDKKYQEYAKNSMGGDRAYKYLGKILKGNKYTMGAGNFLSDSESAAPYSNASWRSFRDTNKVYGPVDAIKSTNVRGDEGLQFNQSITLNFDYEMKSYDGINTRAAFLDLLSNILTVTYSTGTFWGGGYRMTSGSPQSNVFANLPIFKMAQEGKLNGFGDLLDGAFNSLKSIWDQVTQCEGLVGAIKTLGSSLFSMFTGAALNQLGRPTKVALQSLLEPVPTGMWHLTIGNPMHPIMVMGNMILEKTEIEHYGPLGLDDFPTGLRVTCTLKHGKPRDTSMIENMYVLGHSRVYIPVGENVLEMYNEASGYKQSRKSRYKTLESNSGGSGNSKPDRTVGDMIDSVGSSLSGYARSGEQWAGDKLDEVGEVRDTTWQGIMNRYFGTGDESNVTISSKGGDWRDKKNKKQISPSGGNGQILSL